MIASTEEMAAWAVDNPTPGRASAGRVAIQRQFGCSRHAAGKAATAALASAAETADTAPPEVSDTPRVTYSEDEQGATLETRSYTIRTVQDALDHAEVDLKVWQVDRFLINKWEMGYKDAEDEAQAKQLWQVKVWLKRKVLDGRDLAEIVVELMDAHSPSYSKLPARKPHKPSDLLMELCIFDLHIGKYAWGEESGENYDHRIAVERMYTAVEELLAKTVGMKPDRILLPAGNDYLHIDNIDATTARGTGQDVDTRFKKVFRDGKKALIAVIDRLLSVAPVEVKIVPGNHDADSMFHLGDSLASWYRNCKDVTVDNRARPRKYYRWGKVLLGYSHGGRDCPADKDLPMIMAQEQRENWAVTSWREWHTGHIHTKKKLSYIAADTYNGVHVRRIPALCGTDAWHFAQGFVKNWKLAEALLWDKEAAYIGEVSTGLDPWEIDAT